jgi:hypothetical protein
MRFFTRQECEAWRSSRARSKPEEKPGVLSYRLKYPNRPYRVYYIAKWISLNLLQEMPALLEVTEWGIFPGIDNEHLYYRLRESYHDYRLLHEAPGHFFLSHETDALASFLQLAILNGWGGYVLAQADQVNLFFSHDEVIGFYSTEQAELNRIIDALSPPQKQ